MLDILRMQEYIATTFLFLQTLGLSHFLKDNEQATVIELTETIKMIKDLSKGCFNHCHQIIQDQNG